MMQPHSYRDSTLAVGSSKNDLGTTHIASGTRFGDAYVKVTIVQDERHHFRQTGPGRPGPKTRYLRKSRGVWRLTWSLDEVRIAYDHKSDGMYPLLTNDRSLTDTHVFEAHKGQPVIEKRFEQTKAVFELAPVLLKNEGRIEAFFFLFFIALLIQALIERELRVAMKREGIDQHRFSRSPRL